MPARKTVLTDAERAKRMRELARETGADNDPATLDRALRKIVGHRPEEKSSATPKSVPKTQLETGDQ
jgi:hypothetical protein